MFRYLRLIVAFLFFVVVLGVRPLAVLAQTSPAPTAPRYNGLNLLVMDDQSSSMGGPPFGGTDDYGPEGTDPNGLRFTGPQYAVKHIDYLLQAMPHVTTQTEVNLAMVAFGTDQRPILNWQAVGTNANTSNWETAKAKIIDDLSESRWTGRNLKETNFEGVFASADTYFNNAPSTPGVNYRNVILLITDGAPCVSADPAFQEEADDGRTVYNCLLPGRRDAMKAHLSRLYNFTASRFVPPNFEIYVIALDVGIPQPYWSEFESDWARIVCNGQPTCDASLRYRKVDDANQIGQQINLILNDALKGVLPPFDTQAVNVPPGQFTVKPLRQALRVDVFKLTNDSVNPSFSANGQPVSPVKSDPLSTIDMYEFDQPAPGTWTVTLPTQVAGVQYSTIPPVVTVDGLPDTGEVFSTVPVTFTLSKSDGTPLAVDPNYPPNLVSAVARIYDATLPDRDKRPMVQEITLTDAANGEYSYVGAWTPLKDGVYEVRVSASYLNASGQPETIVSDQTVKDSLEVAGSFFEWQGVQPLSERADKPFTARGVVKNAVTGDPIRNTSSLKVRVTLTKSDGTLYKEEVLSNSGQAPGEVLVSFTSEDAGTYNAQLAVIYDDGVNPPQALGNASSPQQIEARAVHPLMLQILQPPAGDQEAQRFNLWPFELDLNVSVPIQVVLLDTLNNQYVSLAVATNGAESVPSLTIDGQTIPLVELQAGVYTTQSDDLSMGEHNIAASINTPDALLAGDYIWASPAAQSAQITINRTFSASLLTAIVVLIGVVAAAGVGGFILWRRSVWLAQFPLKGKLIFGITEGFDDDNIAPIPSATFDFSRMRPQHTYTFKNVSLPGSFKRINKITISTKREQLTSERGEAYITELIIDGESVSARKLVPDVGHVQLKTSGDGTQRLMVIKEDDGGFYGSDWLGGAGGGFGKATEINMGGATRPGWGGDTQIES